MPKKTKCCFLVDLLQDGCSKKQFWVSQGHIDEFISLYLGDGFTFMVSDHMEFIKFENPLMWYKHA